MHEAFIRFAQMSGVLALTDFVGDHKAGAAPRLQVLGMIEGGDRAGRIERRKDQAIEIIKDNSLRRFSAEDIELLAERQDLRLQRSSRPEQPDDRPPDQFEDVCHAPSFS
jgi:hypothetical protein